MLPQGSGTPCGTLLIPMALYEGMFSRIPSVHLGFNVDGTFKDRESMQEMPNVERWPR